MNFIDNNIGYLVLRLWICSFNLNVIFLIGLNIYSTCKDIPPNTLRIFFRVNFKLSWVEMTWVGLSCVVSVDMYAFGCNTLSRPSITSRLTIANRSHYHCAPVLWNSLPSDISHIAHHATLSPILNLPVSDLIPTSLSSKVINPSLSMFLSLCIHLGYPRTDISGIDQALLFHLTHILLSFILISFTPIFYFIWLVSVYD